MDNNKILKQYVIDFVEGRVNASDFIVRFRTDPELVSWLQSIVPKGKKGYIVVPDERAWFSLRQEVIPYDVQNAISESVKKEWDIGSQLNVHGEIFRLITEAFPDENIKKDDTIKKLFDFMITSCPSYIGGQEAYELLFKIINDLPVGLNKTQRKKMLRDKIKEYFHLDGKHYPRWWQDPEWPFYDGRPMKFISQTNKGEISFYYFEDVETGEKRMVEQFT